MFFPNFFNRNLGSLLTGVHGFTPYSFLHVSLKDIMLYLKNTIYYNFSEIITYFTSKFHMEPV